MNDNDKKILEEFTQCVNMTANQLKHWLETAESKKVGYKDDGKGESVGHESGRHIVRLLGKSQTAFTGDDLAHARKVVGYVHRHLAQKPDGDITETPWRYSLMNWGHDPAKAG